MAIIRCAPGPVAAPTGTSSSVPEVDTKIGSAACIIAAATAGGDPAEMCTEEAETQPALTPGLLARALQDTTLPPSTLQVQPPNGRTLVNFDTNFYTDRNDFTRTITLLGQQVQLRIFATTYTWHFDDGQPLTTTTPGAPHPDLQVTHDYQTKGTYTPRVDTTYGADWRIGNGTWQRVPGTVTIPGETVDLDAIEGRPTLVS